MIRVLDVVEEWKCLALDKPGESEHTQQSDFQIHHTVFGHTRQCDGDKCSFEREHAPAADTVYGIAYLLAYSNLET